MNIRVKFVKQLGCHLCSVLPDGRHSHEEIVPTVSLGDNLAIHNSEAAHCWQDQVLQCLSPSPSGTKEAHV